MISELLSSAVLDAVIEELSFGVVVLDRRRAVYENGAARALSERLRHDHGTELTVLLRDHVEAVEGHLKSLGRVVSMVTAGNGEPFYFHIRRITVKGAGPLTV